MDCDLSSEEEARKREDEMLDKIIEEDRVKCLRCGSTDVEFGHLYCRRCNSEPDVIPDSVASV